MKLCSEISAGLLFGGNIGCEHQGITFEMIYVQIERNWKDKSVRMSFDRLGSVFIHYRASLNKQEVRFCILNSTSKGTSNCYKLIVCILQSVDLCEPMVS